MGRSLLHGFSVIAILLLGAIAYSNTLTDPFVFDDIPNIQENRHIQIDDLSAASLWEAGTESPSKGRPLAYISFALNYRIGGKSVVGYHVVNILIHLFAGVMAYGISLSILQQAARVDDGLARRLDESGRWFAAFLSGLVFTLHPIQTQSVTYIVQRMNSLAALLYLIAFALYLSGRNQPNGIGRWFSWTLGLAFWLLSLTSKQISVTLPAAVLLYEWYFYGDLSLRWIRRGAIFLGFVLLALAIIVFAQFSVVGEVFDHYQTREFTMVERLLTQTRVLVLYATLSLFPAPGRFNLLHDISTSKGLFEPTSTLYATMGLAVYFLVACGLARWSRLASFCLLWPLINLAVESSILPLEMVYEHRMYLPLFGFSLLVGSLAAVVLPSRPALVRLGFAGIVGLGLTALTWTRNAVWHDPITLWSDIVAKSPNLPRALINRGGAYAKLGEWDKAITDYNRAIQLRPDDASLIARGMAHLNSNNIPAATRDFQEAIAAASTPEMRAIAHRNRGTAHSAAGDIEAAIADYTEAIKLVPDDAQAHFNRANAWRRLEQYQKAIDDYAACVALTPRSVRALNNLAALLAECPDASLRDPKRAIAHAEKACELTKWKDWQVLDTLAAAYGASGDFAAAARWEGRSLELTPDASKAEIQARLDAYKAGKMP